MEKVGDVPSEYVVEQSGWVKGLACEIKSVYGLSALASRMPQ